MLKIKDDNYIQISGWMINRLNLKGNELLIYAIIYGFCQDGNSSFQGGLSYFEQWLQVSKQTVIRTLQSLTDKGLIRKIPHSKNDSILNDYVIVDDRIIEKEEPKPIKSDFVLGKPKKVDNRIKELFTLANSFTDDPKEKELLYRFINNSLQLKKTLTVESFRLQLEMLKDLDPDIFESTIEDTITSGWINVKYVLQRKKLYTFNNAKKASIIKSDHTKLDLADEQF